jgi:hypothetical protein
LPPWATNAITGRVTPPVPLAVDLVTTTVMPSIHTGRVGLASSRVIRSVSSRNVVRTPP